MTDLAQTLERAVEIHERDHLSRRIEAGEHLRVKLGLDPTAPDIHVGHLVVLDVLRAFQDAGHTAVLIVGDFTALIGDPSGRSESRPALTREQVDANARTYFEQAYRVLRRDRVEIHGNAEWLGGMTNAEVLRLLGKATLQQVLQREDFSKRLESGVTVGAHEVLYPFNQAYDSVAIRADVEIGGTDQLFNLLFGREIQRAYGQPAQDVAVFPLLPGTDGVQKMSKSLGNYIGITEPAEEIYGKTMSIPDPMIEPYLRLVSGLPEAEVASALAMPARDAKATLARALVTRLHSPAAAEAAEDDFERKFRRHELPAEIAVHAYPSPVNAVTVMIDAGFVRSASEARRLIMQGGVKVRGKRIDGDVELADSDVLQVGKRRFARVRVESGH
jgi:tyrosyl-tRNA synthetase